MINNYDWMKDSIEISGSFSLCNHISGNILHLFLPCYDMYRLQKYNAIVLLVQ